MTFTVKHEHLPIWENLPCGKGADVLKMTHFHDTTRPSRTSASRTAVLKIRTVTFDGEKYSLKLAGFEKLVF